MLIFKKTIYNKSVFSAVLPLFDGSLDLLDCWYRECGNPSHWDGEQDFEACINYRNQPIISGYFWIWEKYHALIGCWANSKQSAIHKIYVDLEHGWYVVVHKFIKFLLENRHDKQSLCTEMVNFASRIRWVNYVYQIKNIRKSRFWRYGSLYFSI